MKRRINWRNVGKMILTIVLAYVLASSFVDGLDREDQFRQQRVNQFRAGSVK